MRDKKRIRPTLQIVQDFWEDHPDWRLGQLIRNACPSDHSVFSIEDDALIRGIERMNEGERHLKCGQ